MNARERLITSAQELLWERGYVGTSPRAIQERARAGQGSMYHHFKGKPDLALAAVRRSAEELRRVAEAQLDQPGTAMERLRAYARRKRDVLRGCPIGRLAHDPDVVKNPSLREPIHETLAWLEGRLAELVREAQSDGEIDPVLDPASAAVAFLAALQGGYVLARAAGSVEPFERAAEGALLLLARAKPRPFAGAGLP